MKQLTNKQRAKIYRQAAEMIFESKGSLWKPCFGCEALSLITKEDIGIRNLKTIFPEFGLFAQHETMYVFWNTDEYQERTLGFLLAEQIAMNP